jgi:hypothetical protein
MSLPASVSGFIIDIPDEAHHPLTDNKTMSLKNAHYIPSTFVIPSGTAIAFVHGDPNHIHSEIVKDTSTGNAVWQTIPVIHPGGSDTKILGPGSYTISDQKYSPPMSGNITVLGNIRPQPTSRILNSSSLLNGREAKASMNIALTTARVFVEAADVE